jgi:Tfp pilus assembly protein PilX
MTCQTRIFRRLRRVHPGEGGFAMILVLGFALVLTIVASFVGLYTMASLDSSRHEQDSVVALSAAEAGVDDYLARLNANSTYWQSVDCTNPALQGPKAGTNSCGWTSGTAPGWAVVADAKNPEGQACSTTPTPAECPRFHYDIDTSSTPTNGTITITSTGSSGPFNSAGQSLGTTRTVQEILKEQGFEDYLYFTNYEDLDPSNPAIYGTTNSTTVSECSQYHWAGRNDSSTSPCVLARFVTGDTINGPLHTNDTMLMQGSPAFNGVVETSDPNCRTQPYSSANCWWTQASASPSFAKSPAYVPVMPLPPSNSALKAQVTSGQSNGTPGCLYTGPTRIQFNSNGTMTVYSPYTTTVNSGCGTAPWKANTAQTVNVPTNNVIYVQNVPSTQQPQPPAGKCAAGSISGYPQSGDVGYTTNAFGEYNCTAGTVYIDGTLKGRVTVTADNSVIIVGNLTYAGGAGGTDSLGLISNSGNVEVYHPVLSSGPGSPANINLPACTSTPASAFCGKTMTNPTIDAAILSLNHSFEVQNPGGPVSCGSTTSTATLGNLNVFGAIAQNFRGAVGCSNGNGTLVDGYNKSYSYDSRLQYAPPPYFLKPSVTSWRAYTFAELPAEY